MSRASTGVRETPQQETNVRNLEQFDPIENEVIGILHIPKQDKLLPVLEGTDEEMLNKGVGHYTTTAYPSDNGQICYRGIVIPYLFYSI